MDELELLAGRVEALERDARRWRLVATLGLLAAMATGGALAVHWRQGEIVARRVTIVGPNGEKRIILDAKDAPGEPLMVFRDADGKDRILMGSQGGGEASINFHGGRENRILARIGYMGAASGSGVALDSDGGAHVVLSAGPESPTLALGKGDRLLTELPFPDFAAGLPGFNP